MTEGRVSAGEGEGERSSSDRRRERRPVSMRGYIIRRGGETHVIQIIDLNYGGCGVQTPVALDPGEAIQLSVHNRGAIPAEVRWYRSGKAGLDFEPAPPRVPVERQATRVEVSAEVGLRSIGRNSFRVRVFDLSSQGCKVELVERPLVGDAMSVKFDGLDVLEATVAWVEGATAGLTFRNAIHPAVLDLLLQRMGGSSG
jgi:hypothetical protein